MNFVQALILIGTQFYIAFPPYNSRIQFLVFTYFCSIALFLLPQEKCDRMGMLFCLLVVRKK